MPNPMMEMLNRSARPNNPLQMVAEFRKFAQSMTPQKAEQLDGWGIFLFMMFVKLKKHCKFENGC